MSNYQIKIVIDTLLVKIIFIYYRIKRSVCLIVRSLVTDGAKELRQAGDALKLLFETGGIGRQVLCTLAESEQHFLCIGHAFLREGYWSCNVGTESAGEIHKAAQ